MSYSGMTMKGNNPTRNQWAALENTTSEEKDSMAIEYLVSFLPINITASSPLTFMVMAFW